MRTGGASYKTRWLRRAEGATAAGLVLSLRRARRWQLRWGANDGEVVADLAGDELLPHADRSTTRAVTIAASPHEVWPWWG
jgi:hypothetical protein